MDGPVVTLGLSRHRVEVLPLAEPLMRSHALVVLEEPRLPGFREMLEGSWTIDRYLEENTFEFPDFTRRSCELMRRLHDDGISVLQVEPYLEELGAIYDFFDAGGRPEHITDRSLRRRVYETERCWTGSLMHHYWKAPAADFQAVVAGLKAFARQDATRGLLRDQLRAGEIAYLAQRNHRIYVEAGYLHVTLRRELRARLGNRAVVQPKLLLEPVARRLWGRPHVLLPGDRLVMRVAFQPDFDGECADLLAARALIMVKIEPKEEQAGPEGTFPHTEKEVDLLRLVERLSFDDCSMLFGKIRHLGTAEAEAVVRDYSPTAAPDRSK
jgi:hypothetical protein